MDNPDEAKMVGMRTEASALTIPTLQNFLITH
jgi:hypothetical protein